MLKSYLTSRELHYEEIDLTEKTRSKEREFYREHGNNILPMLLIDDEKGNQIIVPGYDEDKLNELFG
jgi:glutaredoxin